MSSLLVAAIDFGTTFSGYAFSSLHDYKRDPLKIFANAWLPGIGQLVTQKTPTCVLFDAAGTFHSFGFEAEEKYSNLALEDNHHDWYYFRRFKMMLYDKKVLVHFLYFNILCMWIYKRTVRQAAHLTNKINYVDISNLVNGV